MPTGLMPRTRTSNARSACSGSELKVDYAGTSPQIERGLNTVMNYTYAYTVYPIKCALDPLTRRNDGSYRPITVDCAGRQHPQSAAPGRRECAPPHRTPPRRRRLQGARPAIPRQVLAESGSAPSTTVVFGGIDRTQGRYSQIMFASGGMGASAHTDGHDCTCFPTNAGAGSIEAFESLAPIVVWKKDLRVDSGGAGEFRGGLGQDIELEMRSSDTVRLSMMSDRQRNPAQGLLGGKPGALMTIALANGGTPHPKSRSTIAPGDRLKLQFSGGGGFGDPKKRDPAAVKRDMYQWLRLGRCGKRRDYGV